MKKINNKIKQNIKTISFFSLLIIAIAGFTFLVSAANVKNPVISFQSGYLKAPDGGNELSWMIYIKKGNKTINRIFSFHQFRDADGGIYYCVQPNIGIEKGIGKPFTSTYDLSSWDNLADYDSEHNHDGSKLADAVANTEKIKEIMYYGYGYTGRTAEWWSFITQTMIWKEIYPELDIGFASSCTMNSDSTFNCNATTKFDTYIKQIETDIENHGRKPSFDSQSIGTMVIGESKTITDTNEVLSKYKVESCQNCSASINGNNITIRATAVGEIRVNLVQNYNKYNSKDTYVFTSVENSTYGQGNSIQKVANTADPNDVSSTVMATGDYKESEVIVEKLDGKIQGDVLELNPSARLAGATICLYKSDNTQLRCLESDGVNPLNFGTYEKGSYYLKEIISPRGFVKKETKYSFTIDGYGDPINKTIKNERYSTFTLYKRGEDGNILLSNAEIEIYTDEDILFFKGSTDREGKISSEKIPAGNYYYIETKAPEGYGRNKEKHFFTIDSDGGCYITETLVNTPTSIEITKTDLSTGSPIEGAIITIYQKLKNDNWVQYYQGITDKEGKIKVNKLPYGDYYFVETEAPEGYILNDEKHYFSINDEGYIIKDNLPNEKYGKIYISKTDLSKANVVEGATIEIYRINEDESADLIYTGITNNEGKIEYDLLTKGKYYFIEKNAPEGYILNDEKHFFDVTENGITIDQTLTNEKFSNVTFEKKDLADDTLLSNAKICIYSEDDTLIECITTNENGLGIIKLGVGNYYYIEEIAPEGYEKIEEKTPFTIEEEGSSLTLTVYNELIVVPVPDTGLSNNLAIISIILVGIGTILIIIPLTMKKNNTIKLILKITGTICITISVILSIVFYLNIKKENKYYENNQNLVNEYLEQYEFAKNDKNVNNESTKNEENKDNKTPVTEDKIIGVLSIPQISLNIGFYDKDSKMNSVNYGIEVIDGSTLPNNKGQLIIAGHSGSSKISYFGKLNKLKLDDVISIYFEGTEYKYILSYKEQQPKTGEITIKRTDRYTLVLITCTPKKKGQQDVYYFKSI